MPRYWCELCWACVILCGLPWVGITLVAVIMLFSGAWVPLAWVGGTSVVYGGLLFMVAYFEARSHWKRKEI
jgi:hypothetical protein